MEAVICFVLSLMATGDLLDGREMASEINLIKDGLLGKRWQTPFTDHTDKK